MVVSSRSPIDSAYLWLRRGQAARVLSRGGFLQALASRTTTLGPHPLDRPALVEAFAGELALLIATATRA